MMLVDWTPAPAFIGSLVAASVLELTGWSATNECKLLFLSLSIFCLSLRSLISKVSGVLLPVTHLRMVNFMRSKAERMERIRWGSLFFFFFSPTTPLLH